MEIPWASKMLFVAIGEYAQIKKLWYLSSETASLWPIEIDYIRILTINRMEIYDLMMALAGH